ncbi:MAG: sigma-70 family RNA polymerase sigma factor [Clostridia bacterium]|nr:sigma-70 family RNA polymerase sigma factor [Clostridia bacterium]
MATVPGPDSRREERLNHMMLTYEKDLLRMCCVYLKDAGLAQDAVQETFLKAYRRMDAFEGRASEKTWLMRIAINTCKDMCRTSWFRHVDRRIAMDDPSSPMPEPAAPPSVEHIALTTAIMALPKKHMEVVLLHYYQGLNIKETAQVLGITAPAVINRLNKARTMLRETLKEEGDA